MRGINKVFIIGILGTDPKFIYLSNNKSITNMNIATNYSYKNRDTGEFCSEVEWHNITLYDRANDFMVNNLKKGAKVYIEGFLKTSKWKNNDETRYLVKIIATDIQILSFKGQNSYNKNIDVKKESLDKEEFLDKKNDSNDSNDSNDPNNAFSDNPF